MRKISVLPVWVALSLVLGCQPTGQVGTTTRNKTNTNTNTGVLPTSAPSPVSTRAAVVCLLDRRGEMRCPGDPEILRIGSRRFSETPSTGGDEGDETSDSPQNPSGLLGSLVVTPESMDLGVLSGNVSPQDRRVILANRGNGDLEIVGVELVNSLGFSLPEAFTSVTLPPFSENDPGLSEKSILVRWNFIANIFEYDATLRVRFRTFENAPESVAEILIRAEATLDGSP